MNIVESYLRAHHDELGLDRLGLPRELTSLVVTPRFQASRHVVVLVLPKSGRDVRLVAKIPRRPGDTGGVVHEAAALGRLAELSGAQPGSVPAAEPGWAPGLEPGSVPAVVALAEVDGQTLLIETAVAGSPLGPEAVRRDVHGAIETGALFIAGLPVSGRTAGDPHWYDRLLGDPLREFARRVPLGAAGRRLVERTTEILDPLRDADLPFVVEHGDLSHPTCCCARAVGSGCWTGNGPISVGCPDTI